MPYQSRRIEEQHTGGEIREHGGAQVLCGFAAPSLLLLQCLQLVLLLLQLLNHRVVRVQRKIVGRSSFSQQALLLYAAFDFPHQQGTQNERKRGGEENGSHAQEQWVGQKFHISPQYQCRKPLPKKSERIAMLPRKTPNGIW